MALSNWDTLALDETEEPHMKLIVDAMKEQD